MFNLDNKVMAAPYVREYGILGLDSGFTTQFQLIFPFQTSQQKDLKEGIVCW